MSNLNEGYLFVIGDVHSCVDELRELLALCEERANGQPYKIGFIGDLIHKGDYPVAVMSEVIKLASFGKLGFIIKGNHEDLIQMSPKDETDRYCARVLADESINKFLVPAVSMSMGGGGMKTVFVHGGLCRTSIKLLDHIDELDGVDNAREFFRNLPKKEAKKYDRINRIRRVDPGSGKFESFDATSIKPANWQEWFVMNGKYGGVLVVHGHEPYQNVRTVSHRIPGIGSRMTIGVDTGCVHGNKLTAVVFHNGGLRNFIEVEAKRKYAPSLAPLA